MILDNNVKYEKFTYETYKQRIAAIINNPKLQQLGLKHEILGKTDYGYPIDKITIGFGEKELFIVGGTHGSEVIGVDFVTQAIENLPNMEDFDPNSMKLIIIPLQNPEGIEISTSTYSKIDNESFKEKSYEYYEKYRTDSLITIAIDSLNTFITEFIDAKDVLTAEKLLAGLKKFINFNPSWQSLSLKNAIPDVEKFNKGINLIDKVDSFNELKLKIMLLCDNLIKSIDYSDKKAEYLKLFLTELKSGFESGLIWHDIDRSNKRKLHQLMFKDDNFENIDNELLRDWQRVLYNEKNHPMGSQVTYDANGFGINLNANVETNPGIELLRSGIKTYGNGPRDNIVRYFKGPIGAPTRDLNSFKYEKENVFLLNELKKSIEKNSYLGTLLYHGTGGLIYYKPYEKTMDPSLYESYLLYNKTLASTYSIDTNYRLLEESSNTGFGDYLRQNFPGVLLIELSKMGGNPIGPYGDENNIHNTIHDNILALNRLMNHFNNQLKNNKVHQK